ncbi:MAG: hypothetical protein J5382_09560 [Bacteroidales bacterium]|nr:hypothetical protein [Bacteroidales bacterium]
MRTSTQQELFEQGLKLCPDCGQIKPLTEFYTFKNGKYYSYCKECISIRNKQSRLKRQSKQNPQQEQSVIVAVEPKKDALTLATEQVATIQGTINALQDTLLSVLAEMEEQKREYETKLAEMVREHQQEIEDIQVECEKKVNQVEREYQARIDKERFLYKPDFSKLTDNDIAQILSSPKVLPRHLIQALYANDSRIVILRYDPNTGETTTMPRERPAA